MPVHLLGCRFDKKPTRSSSKESVIIKICSADIYTVTHFLNCSMCEGNGGNVVLYITYRGRCLGSNIQCRHLISAINGQATRA